MAATTVTPDQLTGAANHARDRACPGPLDHQLGP